MCAIHYWYGAEGSSVRTRLSCLSSFFFILNWLLAWLRPHLSAALSCLLFAVCQRSIRLSLGLPFRKASAKVRTFMLLAKLSGNFFEDKRDFEWMRTEYRWIEAGIKDYGGGWGKITGRVNVRGAWDWDRGRIPNGSRRHPEEMEDGEWEDGKKMRWSLQAYSYEGDNNPQIRLLNIIHNR